MPRLPSEYLAARAQFAGVISANEEHVDVATVMQKTGNNNDFILRGRGGSPEPPVTNVNVRIAGDWGQSPLPASLAAATSCGGGAAGRGAVGK